MKSRGLGGEVYFLGQTGDQIPQLDQWHYLAGMMLPQVGGQGQVLRVLLQCLLQTGVPWRAEEGAREAALRPPDLAMVC